MAKVTKKRGEVVYKTDAKERQAALESAMLEIEKNCGKGSIMRLGEKGKIKVSSISTGILALDAALGIGGLPRGRVIEIYGRESSGKTTIALHAVAAVQKSGGYAAFIDAEHALDPVYAAKLGVNVDDLIISQPDSGEQALQIAEALIRSGAVDLVVVDSVAALVPKSEIDGVIGDQSVGAQARLMSQALRRLTSIINRSRTVLVFINQTRQKIGAPTYNGIVPETTAGGVALKFYASVRIEVRAKEPLTEGGERVGAMTRLKIVKNKMAPPFREVLVETIYGKGVQNFSSVIDLAVEQGVIEKSGSWYSYKGERLGQGKEKASEYFGQNPEKYQELEELLRAKLMVNDGSKLEAEFEGPVTEDLVPEQTADTPELEEPDYSEMLDQDDI